ncbi:MAG: tRNA (adenosine(37)-N6)-threonylcarbamoyltransferase complex transferase subunit TsaD [Mariprofundaceae bacterium]|nr:tRNA (adenosine(37)-N6)-threonylcarbamoyltransferase complex transferase subunit TsaD [Mariprofundaceae bacterium]
MNILAIESSCDETAVALYQGDVSTGEGRIVAECIASQIETHARFGGVVPEVASREHLRILPELVDGVMRDAGMEWGDVQAVAVTSGPGLMGALLVGASYARAVGVVQGIPVLPIHHMEGHLLAPGLEGKMPEFPFIALLVSGGHTMLVRVDGIGRYKVIGKTLDDAAGECFDKSARVLGLSYPGGPEIAKLALHGNAARFKLPRPMLQKNNLDFSFSGLKTAVMYAARAVKVLDDVAKQDLAAGVEAAVSDVLVKKSIKACEQEGVPRLLVAGGVAANVYLRKLLAKEAEKRGLSVSLPAAAYCTDNAAMIAYAAFQRLCAQGSFDDMWDVKSRWPVSELKL